jgi:hypothetical protein
MKDIYIPLGPLPEKLVVEHFQKKEVRDGKCRAKVSPSISDMLISRAAVENKQYITICIPAYNEEFPDMLKTILSVMKNFEFMHKKVQRQ